MWQQNKENLCSLETMYALVSNSTKIKIQQMWHVENSNLKKILKASKCETILANNTPCFTFKLFQEFAI